MTADVGGEIEGFGLGAWEWDVRGNHVRLSRSLCLIYGMPRTDVTLPSLEDFLALVHARIVPASAPHWNWPCPSSFPGTSSVCAL